MAHKALLGPLASEASRAGRVTWGTRACQVPRASAAAWATGAREEPQAPREMRALLALMVFPGTRVNWEPVALLDPRESPAVEENWAQKAFRVPMAPAV